MGERESTWGTRIREPDDFVLHLLEREGVTVVDVGEKLFGGRVLEQSESFFDCVLTTRCSPFSNLARLFPCASKANRFARLVMSADVM